MNSDVAVCVAPIACSVLSLKWMRLASWASRYIEEGDPAPYYACAAYSACRLYETLELQRDVATARRRRPAIGNSANGPLFWAHIASAFLMAYGGAGGSEYLMR